MLNAKAHNYDKHQAQLTSVISYISSEESSIAEKKAAVDFLADYMKNNSNDQTGYTLDIIRQISDKAPVELKEYCKEVLQ